MGESGFGEAGCTGAHPDAERAVCNEPRLRALERTGLGSVADPEMDRIAGWVRRALGVPTALVSLVRIDEQVFPGMAGLPEPFAAARATPLTHSFCQHVVASARALVIRDARTDPLVRDNLALPDLGVVAYAGVPLTDHQGNVVGSLCAISGEPRDWSDEDVATLHDIGRSCSTEIRLRLAGYDTDVELGRRDRLEEGQQQALDRSQVLLTASQAFAATSTVADVRARIGELLASELRPASIETVLLDRRGGPERTVVGRGVVDGVEAPGVPAAPIDDRMPSMTAIRRGRLVYYVDQQVFAAYHPPEITRTIRDRGLHTIVAVPIPGPAGPAGAIVLGWGRPDAVERDDLLVVATIAGYAGHALERAGVLEHRISVAHDMQDAMLTVLPDVDGLTMAARYVPADARQNVGGDWYDAARILDPDEPGGQVLTVSVGDIIGHDLPAVTVMGQVRSMLRQAAWDHPGGPPSTIFSAFETASRGLELDARGTAVLAHLHRPPGGRWLMRWTNAGHPPPILLHPDGRTELLDDHDALFGFTFTAGLRRADHERTVEPGTIVFLYTDGLVERPGQDIDDGTDGLVAVLRATREQGPEAMVAAVADLLPVSTRDDVVAFAIRFDG